MTKGVALITGCSRGIGLGLVEAFSKNYTVIATCRNPDKADSLKSLLTKLNQPAALPLDIADDDSIKALFETVKAKYGNVDVLVNNAGVATNNHPHDPLGTIQRSEMNKVLTTNVSSTCQMTQTMLPILKGKDNGAKGKVIYISSFLGSISCNNPKETNFYMATSYRCSKAAMNQMVKCFSLSDKNTLHISVSPGHVQTDMGNASGRTAPLTVDVVAEKISRLPEIMTDDNNGAFMDYEAKIIPY